MIQDGNGSEQQSRIVYSDDEAAAGCASIFTAIFIAIFAVSLVNRWTVLAVIFGVLAVLGIGATLMTYAETRRWEAFELHFPEWPLTLGSTSMVELVRRSKRSTGDTDIRLVFELECEEAATYRVGTDTRTDTETVLSESISVTARMQANVCTAQIPVTIPLYAGGPSLDLASNKIKWTLSFDPDELSSMGKQKHEIEVVTTLDPHLAETPQDAV